MRTPLRRERLDSWLVEHGLAPTREKAQALVMAGRVQIDARPATKPGSAVPQKARVEVLPGPSHVGRGALKLEGALDTFDCDPRGLVAVDVGSSTGGFTETLLRRGAIRVYAVDVGRAQLHERLRGDGRVVPIEGKNARYLSEEEIPEPCGFATVDVSFISVLKILPALKRVLAPEAHLVVLVKPQFEVGRLQVGRGGIVKDPRRHREAVEAIARGANAGLGYGLRAACASPLAGAEGNREFFLHLVRDGSPLDPAELEGMIGRAVGP
jgi:23S rRNA (cytidine1920-2'-O)/16S rRNA (cytidine1409-2'-O)-methyltransferase